MCVILFVCFSSQHKPIAPVVIEPQRKGRFFNTLFVPQLFALHNFINNLLIKERKNDKKIRLLMWGFSVQKVLFNLLILITGALAAKWLL